MKFLVSMVALVAFACSASAQCANGQCSAPKAVSVAPATPQSNFAGVQVGHAQFGLSHQPYQGLAMRIGPVQFQRPRFVQHFRSRTRWR